MDINKKSRTELKAYFVTNAIPTASNFSDFIDAGLSQKDDGLVKSAGEPLQIAASTAGDRPALQLYESFATDLQPAWALSLRSSDKVGLGVSDGTGQNRLFIDAATGNLGIGTIEPAGYKLYVAGSTRVAGTLAAGVVGIGTTDPAGYKLYVAGNTCITGTLATGQITQEDWKSPTLLNGWVNYGSGYNNAGYFKDSCGFVHLRGLIRSGTIATTAPTGTIFQLPAGYRPPARQLLMASTYSSSASANGAARVDIDTDGNVLAYQANNSWLCLDGIAFRLA